MEFPGISEFLANETSYRHLPAYTTGQRREPHAIVQVDFAGAGGEELVIHPSSAGKLAEMVQESAAEAGIPLETENGEELQAVKVFSTSRAAWLSFGWIDANIAPDRDTMDRIEAGKLQVVGQILSHVVTQVVRQTAY